jgi:ABC-type Fe3+/spermidine/putrescine transport system ATPase subunit
MDGTSALTLCNQGTERGTIGSSLKESCPLIEVAGLGKTHGDQVALTDISFVAGQGKLIGIIGPTGVGKTTLLKALAGLLPAEPGAKRVAYSNLACLAQF